MNPRAWLCCLLFVGVGLLPQRLSARSPAPAKSRTEAPADPFPTALSSVVAAVKRDLGQLPPGVIVASAPFTSDMKAPRAAALRLRLLQLVASSISRPPAAATVSRLVGAAAAARKRGLAGFVWLRPEVRAGRLALTAEAYSVGATVWSRAARPGATLQRQVHAEARLDAQLRLYLTPLRIGEPRVEKFLGADRGIVALACGDIDADGLSEVVSMSRRRWLIARLAAGRVVRERDVSWASLSGIGPVPLREPLGTVTLVARDDGPKMWIDASLSDRGQSLRLDDSFTVMATSPQRVVPFGSGSACVRMKSMYLDPKLSSCWGGPVVGLPARLPLRADAVASARIVRTDGTSQRWLAVRGPSGLRLHAGATGYALGRAGAQVAVGDLDQDGQPDVVSTRDVQQPRHDKVDVRSIASSGLVQPRFTLPVLAGVDAVAICPVDDAGVAPVVLASGGEIWLIR